MSNTAGRKVADADTVRVTVPLATTIQQGEFALVGGFFGLNESTPKTDTSAAQDIELTIAVQIYETDQILTTDAFNMGDIVYFDSTARLLTTVVGTNRPVGRVCVAKDSNNVIWFIPFAQRGT